MDKPTLETDAEPIRSPAPLQFDDCKDEMVSHDWEFNAKLADIAKKISKSDLKHMKLLLSGEGGTAEGVLEKIEDGYDLIKHLKHCAKLDRNNLLHLQALIWTTGNEELHRDLVHFATQFERHPLHFYESEEPAEGQSNVHFHVSGTVTNRTNVEILRGLVARYLRVPEREVHLNGIVPFRSIVITFRVPKRAIQTLKNLTTCQKAGLQQFCVDKIFVDGEEIVLAGITFDEPPSLSEKDEMKRVLKLNSKLENDLSNIHQLLLHNARNTELEQIISTLHHKVEQMKKEIPVHPQAERSFDKQMEDFQSQNSKDAVEAMNNLLTLKERMIRQNHADIWQCYDGCLQALRAYVYGIDNDTRRNQTILGSIEESETQSVKKQDESDDGPIFMQRRYKDALHEISMHLSTAQKNKLIGRTPLSESEKRTLQKERHKFMHVLLQRDKYPEEIKDLHDHVMKMLSALNDEELNNRAENLFKAVLKGCSDIVNRSRQRSPKMPKDPKTTTIYHRSKSVSQIPTDSVDQQLEDLLMMVNNIVKQIGLPEVTVPTS